MIKVQMNVPDVYYNYSRDFQFLGRLYDLVLNYSKTQVDQLYSLPFSDDFNTKLADLMSLTLGFQSRHNYNINQLVALCSSFVEILRNKGNIQSINMTCDALARAEGLKESIYAYLSEEEYHIDFFVPEDLSDTNLLKDILIYILPAGMTYSINRSTMKKGSAATTIGQKDVVLVTKDFLQDIETSTVVSKVEVDYNANKDKGFLYIPNGQNPVKTPGWIANTTVVNPYNTTPTESNENVTRLKRPTIDTSESGKLKVTSTNTESNIRQDIFIDYDVKNLEKTSENESED